MKSLLQALICVAPLVIVSACVSVMPDKPGQWVDVRATGPVVIEVCGSRELLLIGSEKVRCMKIPGWPKK